jgi:hypothetical protein
MTDNVFENFLRVQYEQAMALAAASDILSVTPESAGPPRRYVAQFACRGLVSSHAGQVAEASRFEFGIWLPDDYLRSPDIKQVVTIFRPWSIFHPNAAGPFICLGRLTGGTPLVDILFQIHEIVTYQKWSAHDGLNPLACEWARNNQHRFPVDRRPLKRKEQKP